MENDLLNGYFVNTVEFIGILRAQISILEREIEATNFKQLQKAKEAPVNKRNTKYTDKNFIVSVYKANNFSVKKTLETLHLEGVSISDKQLRNILQEAGVYTGRKGEKL